MTDTALRDLARRASTDPHADALLKKAMRRAGVDPHQDLANALARLHAKVARAVPWGYDTAGDTVQVCLWRIRLTDALRAAPGTTIRVISDPQVRALIDELPNRP